MAATTHVVACIGAQGQLFESSLRLQRFAPGRPYHSPNHPTISAASRSGASSEIQCDTPSSTSNRYGAVTNRSAARAATGPMNSSPVLHTYIVGTETGPRTAGGRIARYQFSAAVSAPGDENRRR